MDNDQNNDKKYIGDEFAEETEESGNEKELKGMYDLVLPPGIPYKIVIDAVDKFNLEVTTRKCAIKTIDVDTDNLLVLRGELDDVNNAHDYIYKYLSERYHYSRPRH